ncbi:MAG: GAF domain-containing protein [Anaerolineae bacterium]|nr:GAF domain-containing protein [Anaerolineae bacterium]
MTTGHDPISPPISAADNLLRDRSSQLLDILFDTMPMGIVILDREFRLARFNPTWAGHVLRYTRVTPEQLQPGVGFFELIPDVREVLEAIFERVLQGEPFAQDSVRLVADGIASYWNLAFKPVGNGNGPVGILAVSTDMTRQVQALREVQQAHERTEQRVAERTRELMTLINVQQALTSRSNASEVLQLVADESRILTNTDVSAVFLPDDDGLYLAVMSSEVPLGVQVGHRMSLTDSVSGIAFQSGKVQIVADVPHHDVIDPQAKRIGLRSLVAIPLMSGMRPVGVLSVGTVFERPVGAEEIRLLMLMVPSAVIALENVRRYEQARETAVLAERGRLARDLHDAVTQTLFSASLTAEVLPRIWERNPQEGLKRLDKLRELTRGALAEMRTLLLELRPSALVETPLCDLLRQLAEGIAGRTGIRIQVEVKGENRLPSDVQIAFYRIAQEALNNVAKHSNAAQSVIDLRFSGRDVRLSVSDDGSGFDPAASPANHLGLRIMAERAEDIGAALTVDTQRGQGTTITVVWSKKEAFA